MVRKKKVRLGLVAMTGISPETKGVRWGTERKSRRIAVDAIFIAAKKKKIDVLLFPGWTVWVKPDATHSVAAVWHEVEWMVRRCDKNKIAAIFQVSHKDEAIGAKLTSTTIAYGKSEPIHVYVQQLFTRSGDARPLAVEALVKLLYTDENRRVTLKGIDIALVICGENNLLTVPNKGRAYLRGKPNDSMQWRDYDVLFNLAHTRMGEQGKLVNRFKVLSSKNKQHCLHCTNATDGDAIGKAHLYGYCHGRKEIDDKSIKAATWADDKTWCIYPIEV